MPEPEPDPDPDPDPQPEPEAEPPEDPDAVTRSLAQLVQERGRHWEELGYQEQAEVAYAHAAAMVKEAHVVGPDALDRVEQKIEAGDLVGALRELRELTSSASVDPATRGRADRWVRVVEQEVHRRVFELSQKAWSGSDPVAEEQLEELRRAFPETLAAVPTSAPTSAPSPPAAAVPPTAVAEPRKRARPGQGVNPRKRLISWRAGIFQTSAAEEAGSPPGTGRGRRGKVLIPRLWKLLVWVLFGASGTRPGSPQ